MHSEKRVLPAGSVETKTGPFSQEGPTRGERKIPDFKIEGISNSWNSVCPDTTTILTWMLVKGPDLSETSVSISCSIHLNGVKMFENQPEQLTLIKAAGGNIVRFITRINNNNQSINQWWASHIRNGEKTKATMQGKLKISRGENNLTYPFFWENEFQTNILEGVNTDKVRTIKFGLYTLQIKSLHSEWGEITPEGTRIKHLLKIHNPSLVPGAPIVNEVGYDLYLNGIKMTEGSTELPLIIWPGSTESVSFVTKLDSKKIKEWWVSHIKSDEKSSYRLTYTLFVKFLGAALARWPEEIKGTFGTDFLGKKTSQ